MQMVLIIFAINIVYVTFFTVRMIMTLKGYRYIAAAVSVVEIVIYVIGLGLVLDNLNEIQNLIAYAVGYGCGVIIGSKIEEKMALGYITVNVITAERIIEITEYTEGKRIWRNGLVSEWTRWRSNFYANTDTKKI